MAAADAASAASAAQYDPKTHGLREDFVLTKFTKVGVLDCVSGKYS